MVRVAHAHTRRNAERSAPQAGAAFTLIELLVVIAIIAILAAILFPVFAQARDKGRQAACLSNLKQVGLGLIQYAQDYDETLPVVTYGIDSMPGVTSPNDARLFKWMDMLYPYVKSIDVFTCPSAADESYATYRPHASFGVTPTRTVTGHQFFGTYGINDTYNGSATDAQTAPAGQPLANISLVADTIFAIENTAMNTATQASMATQGGRVTWSSTLSSVYLDETARPPLIRARISSVDWPAVRLRHANMANTLFCDGHAKVMAGRQLLASRTVGSASVYYLWTIEND